MTNRDEARNAFAKTLRNITAMLYRLMEKAVFGS
jgi:hypothetical protein